MHSRIRLFNRHRRAARQVRIGLQLRQLAARFRGAAARDSKRGVSGVSFEGLLQLHLIRDRLHAADGARYPYRVVDIFARAHETARLNNTLRCLDLQGR